MQWYCAEQHARVANSLKCIGPVIHFDTACMSLKFFHGKLQEVDKI